MAQKFPLDDWEKVNGTVVRQSNGFFFIVRLDNGNECFAKWYSRRDHPFGLMNDRRVIVALNPNPAHRNLIVGLIREE